MHSAETRSQSASSLPDDSAQDAGGNRCPHLLLTACLAIVGAAQFRGPTPTLPAQDPQREANIKIASVVTAVSRVPRVRCVGRRFGIPVSRSGLSRLTLNS